MDVWLIIDAERRKPIKLVISGHEVLSVFHTKQDAMNVIAHNSWEVDVDIVKGHIEWEK